jgi:hypothetical protein
MFKRWMAASHATASGPSVVGPEIESAHLALAVRPRGGLHDIARQARQDPELLRSAPHVTPTGRLDEVKAARQLLLQERAAAAAGP